MRLLQNTQWMNFYKNFDPLLLMGKSIFCHVCLYFYSDQSFWYILWLFHWRVEINKFDLRFKLQISHFIGMYPEKWFITRNYWISRKQDISRMVVMNFTKTKYLEKINKNMEWSRAYWDCKHVQFLYQRYLALFSSFKY